MKIVHIIARFNVGGTASWLSTLSQELEKLGNESQVIVGKTHFPEIESQSLQELSFIRIPELGRSLKLFDDIRALKAIRKVIKKIEPDIVNTHTAKAGVLGRIAVLSLGTKRPALVHTIHGHLLKGYFGRYKVGIVILIERLLSRYTDLMLFAGQRVRSECLDLKIGQLEKSFIVKPGVRLTEKSRGVILGNQINPIYRGHIKIGWLGRLTTVKRPDRVLEIARKLPHLEFLIGGDGDLREALEMGAPSNCHFFGWIDPLKFWSMVDIALLTSENEALPISIIEAQLCALPCVATNAGSTSEVVLNGVNGFITNMDVVEMAEKLDFLADNSRVRRDFGKKAKLRAMCEFSPETQVSDHLIAYGLAIESHFESKSDI
jgi:glycosyltransferase involved in cell wall biosynthesis